MLSGNGTAPGFAIVKATDPEKSGHFPDPTCQEFWILDHGCPWKYEPDRLGSCWRGRIPRPAVGLDEWGQFSSSANRRRALPNVHCYRIPTVYPLEKCDPIRKERANMRGRRGIPTGLSTTLAPDCSPLGIVLLTAPGPPCSAVFTAQRTPRHSCITSQRQLSALLTRGPETDESE